MRNKEPIGLEEIYNELYKLKQIAQPTRTQKLRIYHLQKMLDNYTKNNI